MATEELRQRFRPAQVRLLLIGESPPVGGSFFYMGNSNLYRHTAEAFSLAYSRSFSSPQEFLDFFRGLGCYLDDLCLARSTT